MRDQDADCVAKPCCTSRCCNSMGSRAFCDTRTGEDAHWVCTGLHPRDERTKPGEAPQDAPHDVLGRRDAVGGTPSLCQEPSETDTGTSTLVGNAPLACKIAPICLIPLHRKPHGPDSNRTSTPGRRSSTAKRAVVSTCMFWRRAAIWRQARASISHHPDSRRRLTLYEIGRTTKTTGAGRTTRNGR